MGKSAHFKKIKRGVKQGYALYPNLLSLYSEMNMRNLEGYTGIKVRGHDIQNLRLNGDTVLVAENKEDLQP